MKDRSQGEAAGNSKQLPQEHWVCNWQACSRFCLHLVPQFPSRIWDAFVGHQGSWPWGLSSRLVTVTVVQTSSRTTYLFVFVCRHRVLALSLWPRGPWPSQQL
jgi:hypothetical protein